MLMQHFVRCDRAQHEFNTSAMGSQLRFSAWSANGSDTEIFLNNTECQTSRIFGGSRWQQEARIDLSCGFENGHMSDSWPNLPPRSLPEFGRSVRRETSSIKSKNGVFHHCPDKVGIGFSSLLISSQVSVDLPRQASIAVGSAEVFVPSYHRAPPLSPAPSGLCQYRPDRPELMQRRAIWAEPTKPKAGPLRRPNAIS